MKKTLLFLYFAGLTGFCAYPQSLTLSNSQGPVPNNSTVVPHGNINDDEIVAYAFVTNVAGTPVSVKVKKVEMHLTAGTTNTFCWGLCYDPSTYISLQTITLDPGETDSIDFSGHLSPNGISGYDLIRYVFYNASDPGDSVCMNVHFAHFPVGIENPGIKPMLSEAFPNPAGSYFQLDYTLPPTLTGKIIIWKETGAMLKDISLAEGSGRIRINTGEMTDGVYFYSLISEGRICTTKKIIVKH
jgi:hypothetical protein